MHSGQCRRQRKALRPSVISCPSSSSGTARSAGTNPWSVRARTVSRSLGCVGGKGTRAVGSVSASQRGCPGSPPLTGEAIVGCRLRRRAPSRGTTAPSYTVPSAWKPSSSPPGPGPIIAFPQPPARSSGAAPANRNHLVEQGLSRPVPVSDGSYGARGARCPGTGSPGVCPTDRADGTQTPRGARHTNRRIARSARAGNRVRSVVSRRPPRWFGRPPPVPQQPVGKLGEDSGKPGEDSGAWGSDSVARPNMAEHPVVDDST